MNKPKAPPKTHKQQPTHFTQFKRGQWVPPTPANPGKLCRHLAYYLAGFIIPKGSLVSPLHAPGCERLRTCENPFR